jgi:hypothetical protein
MDDIRLDQSCSRNFFASIWSYLVMNHKYKTQGTKIEGAKNTKTEATWMSTWPESQAATMRASSEKHEHISTLSSVKTYTLRKRRLRYLEKTGYAAKNIVRQRRRCVLAAVYRPIRRRHR